MSLSWKIYSLIVDVGLLVVFLKFLADYRRLGKRLLLAEDRVDLLERDNHKLYRKLNEVQGVKQGRVKNKPTEKARDQSARNSDNMIDSGSSFSYMSTMLSDTSTQSDSSGSGSYSSSDSGSSSSSSSYDSSSF